MPANVLNRPGSPNALRVASNGAGNGSAALSFTAPAGDGPVPKSSLETMLAGIDPGKTQFQDGSNTAADDSAAPGAGADPNAAHAAGKGGAADEGNADGAGSSTEGHEGGQAGAETDEERAAREAAEAEARAGETPEEKEAREAAEAEAAQAQADSGYAGLTDEAKAHVTELAELLAAGQLQVGEVKRIGKLVVQLRQTEATAETLQQRVTELETQLASAPAEAAASASTNPFAGVVKNAADLDKMRAECLKAMAWAARNPNGGTYEGREVNADQVIDIGIEANEALQVHLPNREKELVAGRQSAAQRERVSQNIRSHPKLAWVHNAEDPLGRRAQMFMGTAEVRNHPLGPMVGVMLALGEKALNEMVQVKPVLGAGRGTPGARPVSTGQRPAAPAAGGVRRGLPAGGGSAGARQPSSKSEIAKAMEKVSKTHSKQSFADFLEKAVPQGQRPGAGRR
jgi:hypothetical protein